MSIINAGSLKHDIEHALGQENWQEALRLCDHLARGLPHDTSPSIWLALIYRKMGLLGCAEHVLMGNIARFPNDHTGFSQYASIAEEMGNHDEALDRWAKSREQFPDQTDGYLRPAQLLEKLGQRKKADAIVNVGLARLQSADVKRTKTDDLSKLPAMWISLAHRGNDLPEVLRRYDLLRTMGLQGNDSVEVATALRRLKRVDEAEAILERITTNEPGNIVAHVEYARTAQTRGLMEEQLRRWIEISEKFPNHPAGLSGAGQVLREMGRFDEAEACVQSGLDRCTAPPFDGLQNAWVRQLALCRGWIAHDRGDYDSACAIWESLEAALPGDLVVKRAYGATRLKREVHALDGTDEQATAGVNALKRKKEFHASPTDDVDFMLFESLGENCEFGLVQRHFGSEPIGLLRWAAVEPENLCDLLDSRFDGLDAEGNIELTITPGQEYFLRDKRFSTGMHTFIKTHEVSEALVMRQLTRRMRYLKSKLLEDLEGGEKIFVYKYGSPLAEALQHRLIRAIQAHNARNTLLIVQVRDRAQAPPLLISGPKGLLIGNLDRPSKKQGMWDISFSSWRDICRLALKAHLAGEQLERVCQE